MNSMTSSALIIPVYQGLTIAGNVLDRDAQGEVYHTVIMDTTHQEEVEVVFCVK